MRVMDTIQIAGVGVLAVAVVTGVWWLLGGGLVRRRKLNRLGRSLGLRPEKDTSALDESGLLKVPPLGPEPGRCSELLHGEVRGAEVFVFDFKGGSGAGDPVALFKLGGGKTLPVFELRPRLRSSDAVGMAFESNPRFNDIYALTGEDEAAVRGLFAGEVLTYFERSENQDWAIGSSGKWLAVTVWPHGQRRRQLEPKQVMGFVEDAKQALFLLADK